MKDIRARSAKDSLPNIDGLSVAELDTLIERAEDLRQQKQEEARISFMNEMRAKASELGIDLDVSVGRGGRRKRSDAGVKLKPKFIGPNGETYTGRGPTPKWLKDLEAKGVNRNKFLVK